MTEIETQREMTRTEIAEYLHKFAEQLGTSRSASDPSVHSQADGDGRVTFMVGDDSATINPPETIDFEIEVEADSSLIGDEAEYEVEFELSWQATESEEATEQELEIK